MATEVLRPHNILLPAPHHRIRPASSSSHRRPSNNNNPAGSATRRSSPPAGRRHHGRKQAASRPAAAEVYAGPAFSTSPEPSALPLPQFPVRKAAAGVAAVVDDAATRDLRRILRLE